MKQTIVKFSILVMLFSFLADCHKKEKDNSSSLAALFLASSRSTSSTGRTVSAARPANVPSRTTQSSPSSLNRRANTANRRSLLAMGKTIPNPSYAVSEAAKSAAIGYLAISSSLEYLGDIGASAVQDMLYIDSSVTAAKATPGTCIPGAADSITITEEMAAALKEYYISQGYTDAAATATLTEKGITALVGKKVSSPAITYTALTNDPNGFTDQIGYTTSETSVPACPTGTNKHENIIKYNSAKTKLSFAFSEKVVIDSANSFTYNGTVSTDSSKNTMVYTDSYKIGTTQYNSTVKIEACDAATFASASCSKIDLSYKDGTNVINLIGKADDSGGMVTTTYYVASAPTQKYYQRELFDTTGTLTALSTSTDGSTYTAYDASTAAVDLAATTYDDNATLTDASLTISVIPSDGATNITEDSAFVIIEAGKNPSTNPESVIGAGYRDTSDTTLASTSGVNIDYWGAETQIATSEVYELTGFSTAGEPTFTKRTVTLAKKP